MCYVEVPQTNQHVLPHDIPNTTVSQTANLKQKKSKLEFKLKRIELLDVFGCTFLLNRKKESNPPCRTTYWKLTLVDEKAVIPIGPMHGANKALVYTIQTNKGGMTMHKTQGKTIDRICVDLNNHQFQPTINYDGLFVTMSRVRTKDHIAILPYP